MRVAELWGLATANEVVTSIDEGIAAYCIQEGGKRARVSAIQGRTRRYPRSYDDPDADNNLDSLPAMDD